jgi:hypothetical protein
LAGVGLKPLIRHRMSPMYVLTAGSRKEICPDHCPILPTASRIVGCFRQNHPLLEEFGTKTVRMGGVGTTATAGGMFWGIPKEIM